MTVAARGVERAGIGMAAALIGAAVAGCSASGAPRGHQVDLNAAAQAAETDIAHYAAIRHDRDRPLIVADER